MTRLFPAFWIFFVARLCAGAPTPPISSERAVEKRAEPVTFNSFARLGVGVSLGSAAVLGSIWGAEQILGIYHLHQASLAHRGMKEKEIHANDGHAREMATRQDEAMKLLVEMANKHAQRISSDDFDGKFERQRVPKEIHRSLEGLFRTDRRNDDTSDLEGYQALKDALAPLLDFE
jgi:hypothetical protein